MKTVAASHRRGDPRARLFRSQLAQLFNHDGFFTQIFHAQDADACQK